MNTKHIKSTTQMDWKSLRDMAKKGIGHSNLRKVADKVKKKKKKK